MYSTTTFDIKVSVIPQYDTKNSFPAENRFVFRYNISIENLGREAIKLLSRKWLIFAAFYRTYFRPARPFSADPGDRQRVDRTDAGLFQRGGAFL